MPARPSLAVRSPEQMFTGHLLASASPKIQYQYFFRMDIDH